MKPQNQNQPAETCTGAVCAKLSQNDPELAGIIANFAFGETQRYGDLDTRTRILITMASCIAVGAQAEYRNTLEDALANGISPIEVKEVLYHAVPYAGLSHVEDLLNVANDVLTAHGVALPLEAQNTVTAENRLEVGRKLQEDIFGEANIAAMYDNAPENQLHIQQYLSANCFGDYQTRSVFDPQTRELLTFSILVSLGGCESQVKGHIAGNVNVGNGKATLLAAATQLLPYIGYPRTLNAIACINAVIPEH